MSCPFCTLPAGRVLIADDHALVIRDGFPVSPGHTLVIPRRHVDSFFDTTPAERASLFRRPATTSVSTMACLPGKPCHTCMCT